MAGLLSRVLKRGNEAEAPPQDRRSHTEATTVPARRAVTSAWRAEAAGRDAARYTLAKELAGKSRLKIQRDHGFAVVPPGQVPGADEVAAAANALVDEIGDAELRSRDTKGGFMAQGFLPESAFTLDSPYMRFALSDGVVGPAADYLRGVPVLNRIDVWYSFHGPEAPNSSQLWHLDHADTTQVKVWVNCSDVVPESGPLTVMDAYSSDRLAEAIDYDYDEGYRVSDEQVRQAAGDRGLTAFEGPKGTVVFVDTSRCFHFGSRVQEQAQPRRIFVAQFLTPYAFKFKGDHRAKAPYRGLAEGAGELERLLLGAV